MPLFYIVPPRKTSGGESTATAVESFNSQKGEITLAATGGLQISQSGDTFTLSPISNYFVRNSGDVMFGNLQFMPGANPDNAFYGLRLYAATGDPNALYAQIGAVYYNSTDLVLKVYDGSAWQTLAQTGALTLSQGDARYLQLSGGNLTGPLSMGSALLRLGNRTVPGGSGAEGQIFWDTDNKSVTVWDGTSWTQVGSGLSSLMVGVGLTSSSNPITSSGTISLNLAYSPTWTGNHTFNNAITFALAQTFGISQLNIGSQATGDLIFKDTGGWTRLPIGATGQILKVVGGKPVWSATDGANTTLGTPTDGSYTDGYFDTWTTSTKVADALDDVSEFLKDIAPAKADLLTSTSLVVNSQPTLYTVKLSAGLPTAWYQNGYSAGNIINSYFLSGSYVLDTPNPITAFRAGKKNTPSTYGTLTHVRYSSAGTSNVSTLDMTAISVIPSTTGTLTVTSLVPYPSSGAIWEKANAEISYTQTADGYEGHAISHTEAGTTNRAEYFKDTYTATSANPTFSVSPTAAEITPVDKWLSGVVYYGYGSTLTIDFQGASGIFNRCYNATQVARIAGTGVNTINIALGSPPNYLATLDYTGVNAYSITLNAANQNSLSKIMTVTLYKAHGTTAASNATLARGICTWGSVSTQTGEYFFDEDYRLILNTTGGTAWDSTAVLANGNAEVRNGTLGYPVSADYSGSPSFTGNQEYQRFFWKTSASTGTLNFAGLTYSNVSPYGTGDINILIQLDGDAQFFDLGQAVGINNGTGDGSSRANSKGGRTTGSGNNIQWSTGVYTTGTGATANLGRFRLIVIFRNSNQQITSVVSN